MPAALDAPDLSTSPPSTPTLYPPYWTPPAPRRGDPADEPCIVCHGPGATQTWCICPSCRADKQRAADAAVKRMWQAHPDW